MFCRTWRGEKDWLAARQESERHHHDESKLIDTGHGTVELSIFEQGQPPHWRIRTLSGKEWDAGTVSLVTQRETPAGTQSFDFVDCGSYLQSTSPIPEPHDFVVRLSLGHRGHVHDYDLEFCEHEHTHDHTELEGLDINSAEYRDAHELAHAHDIEKRFTDKEVTNGQILLFGLTGGLIPCPAAITVMLICIQIKALALGATLVVSFSIGLALTLVTVGWCRNRRPSGRQTLGRLSYPCPQSALFFKPADCRHGDLSGYPQRDRPAALILFILFLLFLFFPLSIKKMNRLTDHNPAD